MVNVLSAPLANQLKLPFIATRTIYEVRERPSRMYCWTALVTSQLLIELPWNILGSNLLFFSWYWTVGFDSSRAGYTYLMITIILPAYYTSFGQVGVLDQPSFPLSPIEVCRQLPQWHPAWTSLHFYFLCFSRLSLCCESFHPQRVL